MFQITFVLSFLNIIDLLGILPFYVSLCLHLLNSRKQSQISEFLDKSFLKKKITHIVSLGTNCDSVP